MAEIDSFELLELARAELEQRAEEGCEVATLRTRFERFEAGVLTAEVLLALLDDLRQLPIKPGIAYVEPSAYTEIVAARPRRHGGVKALPEDLDDRVLGAWLGRCAGCLLGKPVEGWPRQAIVEYLEAAGEYPLRSYFPLLVPNPAGRPMHRSAPESTRGGIVCMPRDDDIDYTILGLHLLEEYGEGFTTSDVAFEWLTHLPYELVYTAERAAYRNLVNGLKPPRTADHNNPYREWIGAQIRADIYGYVAACRPEHAAELAHRDASLSHVKNGIYGAMFVAAAIAAAFGAGSPEEAIEAGLSQIPASSRLFEAISRTLEWGHEYLDWRDALGQVMAAYGGYHRVHTINNACFVVLGLLYGGGDFGRTVSIAVECGLDTDCNGATAGSIAGALVGAKSIPAAWTDPLRDRARSIVAGFDNSSLSELAARTTALSRTFIKH